MISPEILRRYSYFAGADDEILSQLAVHSQECNFSPGEYLFKEGEQAEKLYIITRGEVAISLQLGDGTIHEVDVMVAGDIVGWSALLQPSNYRAHAIANRQTQAIAIDAKRLMGFCRENHEFGYHIMCELIRSLGQRLSHAWIQLAAAYEKGEE